MKFYYVTNIFDLHAFDSETTAPLKFLKICLQMHFLSLFFLNKRNITTSFLMIRPIYGPLNTLFHFFRFLINVYFNEAFAKNFIQNSFHDIAHYRILVC